MKILLKGGFVIDGSGEKGFAGDVLLEDDKIADVGTNITEKVDETIDCTNLAEKP